MPRKQNTPLINELLIITNPSFVGLFAIHELNGEIIVAQPLDREVKDILRISVFAVDEGEPQRSDEAEVEFFLTDVNDNSPVIRPQKSQASVFEVLITNLNYLVTLNYLVILT